MSGEGKRGDAPPAKQPRPSSTLQSRSKGQRRVSGFVEALAPAAAPMEQATVREARGEGCWWPMSWTGRPCLRGHRAGMPEGEARIARKWRRRGLKRLVSRLEM